MDFEEREGTDNLAEKSLDEGGFSRTHPKGYAPKRHPPDPPVHKKTAIPKGTAVKKNPRLKNYFA